MWTHSRELYTLCKERIFLFIDDAADHVGIIKSTIDKCRRHEIPITILTAERYNEWNDSCADIEPLVENQYKVDYLSRLEIESLVDLLDKHGSLGHLAELSKEKRIEEFRKESRQTASCSSS